MAESSFTLVGLNESAIKDAARDFYLSALNTITVVTVTRKQGHPTTIFGKYLFGRRFEI